MVADRLAGYARSLSYRRLPPAVVHEAKRRVLDSWACAFGAYDAAPCRVARRVAQSVKVPTGATLWGTAHRTVPDLAAFANGALVLYLDFNDTYLSKEPAHPSLNGEGIELMISCSVFEFLMIIGNALVAVVIVVFAA